jgi:CRP/FNR family cyclic AMP-dependent transcriptional regulator
VERLSTPSADRTLRGVAPFDELDDGTIAALEVDASWLERAAGARIVEEGSPSDTLHVLVSGRAEVRKREVHRPSVEHTIAEIEAGELIGEVGFFDRLPRPVTVQLLEDSVVLQLSYASIERHAPLQGLLTRRLAARVRRAGFDSLEGERRRAALGELIVKVVVLLSGYALLISWLPRLQSLPSSSSYISVPIIALMGLGAWRYVRNTGYPLDEFGLGRRAFGWSLLESLLLTPPFCAVLVGLKWLLMQTRPSWRAMPLFEHHDWVTRLQQPFVVKLILIYLTSAIVQEFVVRSALQAGLESFLLNRRRRWSAIVVSALMFAVNHLHMSPLFAALAFVPGMFWGWLFSRRRHLIGPTLSHFIVGVFMFFVLGVSLP